MYLRKNTENRGFTVMEIIISVAIIGLIASFILPRVQLAREGAKIAKAQAQLKQFRTAISQLAGDTNEWPGHQTVDAVDTGVGGNEVWDLSTQAAGLTQTDGLYGNWAGPYITFTPVDPWGNNYFLDTDYDIGTSSTVWAAVIGSFGPNGNGQNVYDSDNIIEILSSE